MRTVFNPRQIRADRPYRLVLSLDGLLREFEYQIDSDRFLRIVHRDHAEPSVLDAEIVPYEKETAVLGINGRIDSDHPSLIASMDETGRAHPARARSGRHLQRADRFRQRPAAGRQLRGALREIHARGGVRRLRRGARRADDGRRPRAPGVPLGGCRVRQGGLLRRERAVAEAVHAAFAAEIPARAQSHLRVFPKPAPSRPPRLPPAPRDRLPRATGAPVVAVANGVVVSAGWAGGGGNQVRLRHAGGIETYYLHLSRFGKGIRAGVHVSQGRSHRLRRDDRHGDRPAPRLPGEEERRLRQPAALPPQSARRASRSRRGGSRISRPPATTCSRSSRRRCVPRARNGNPTPSKRCADFLAFCAAPAARRMLGSRIRRDFARPFFALRYPDVFHTSVPRLAAGARQGGRGVLRSLRCRQHRRSAGARGRRPAELSPRHALRNRSAARYRSVLRRRCTTRARQNFQALRDRAPLVDGRRAGAVLLSSADGIARTDRHRRLLLGRRIRPRHHQEARAHAARQGRRSHASHRQPARADGRRVPDLPRRRGRGRDCAARDGGGAAVRLHGGRRRAAHDLARRTPATRRRSSRRSAAFPALYIADGHHRAASAARARAELARPAIARTPRTRSSRSRFPTTRCRSCRTTGSSRTWPGSRPSSSWRRCASGSRLSTGRPRRGARAKSRCISAAAGTRSTSDGAAPADGSRASGLDVALLQQHVLERLLKIGDIRTRQADRLRRRGARDAGARSRPSTAGGPPWRSRCSRSRSRTSARFPTPAASCRPSPRGSSRSCATGCWSI